MSAINPQIDWVPAGKPADYRGWMNDLARGIQIISNKLGHNVDYETVLGDLGIAFIIQGEENSINLIDGAVDVGWWPLEPLGIIRLDFLEQTLGRKIESVVSNWEETKKAPIDYYNNHFSRRIKKSIDAGIPCMAQVGCWQVITGYNPDKIELYGMCTNETEEDARIDIVKGDMPPYAALFFGEETYKIDRKEADLKALQYALSLHKDEVIMPDSNYSLRLKNDHLKYWRTGLKSLIFWKEHALNKEHHGPSYWHDNVLYHLFKNRREAITYLANMKKRHSNQTAASIDKVIAIYDDATTYIKKSANGITDVENREELGKLIDKVFKFEEKAAYELENVVESMM